MEGGWITTAVCVASACVLVFVTAKVAQQRRLKRLQSQRLAAKLNEFAADLNPPVSDKETSDGPDRHDGRCLCVVE